MSDLRDTVTVITGGGKGLGLGLGIEAGLRGSQVVIASRSDATAAVETIRATGAAAESVVIDVSDADAVDEFAKHVRQQYGPINVLVNNAASGGSSGSILDIAKADIRRAFEVNVLGYVWTTQAFAGDLRASAAAGRPAYIMNVGSEHSLGVPPHVTPLSTYTVTKQAELALTDVTRRDFGDAGVKVALLAPGWILTEQVSALTETSSDFADAVLPYAQATQDVARIAFDGLLDDREIIITNPKSVPFARDRAHRLFGDFSWAEHRAEADAGESWVHDGTGDASKCPVAHMLPGI